MTRKPEATDPLAVRIARLAVAEGPNATRHPDVTVYRFPTSRAPFPKEYEPGVILVGQGRKRGYLGAETFRYDTARYLVLASPLPMFCEMIARRGVPILTMNVRLDLALLREVALEMDGAAWPAFSSRQPRGVYSAPRDETITGTAARLLDCLADDTAARVLARSLVRELFFHLLREPCADSLRQIAFKGSGGLQLGHVTRHMRLHYPKPMKVEQLARIAGMSVPTFHEHFKALTSLTPLQYLKNVRLTQARLLMVRDGQSATAAAQQVDYISGSQFSREFRRFFGAPPIAATKRARVT